MLIISKGAHGKEASGVAMSGKSNFPLYSDQLYIDEDG